jgi:hypothetical protein
MSAAHLGFTVIDYSTAARVGAPPGDELTVVVPKRPATLPQLVEQRASSVRLREKRLYFETKRNAMGDVIVVDVSPGTYDVAIFAPGYVPFRTQIVAPRLDPLVVRLHRDPSFPFSAEDTLILGEVIRASGAPHTGFDVTFVDLTESIPNHHVPLNAKGRFAIFAPEKQTSGPVDLLVHHASGIVTVSLASVVLRRPNIARQVPNSPVITVP